MLSTHHTFVGNSHLQHMLESLKEYQVLSDEFLALDASLRIEMPSEVGEWLKEITKWESTYPYSMPTPYDLPERGKSHHWYHVDQYLLSSHS